MIAATIPKESPKVGRPKHPKTADEWAAYEGKPVWCKERNGRPHTAMLLEVMAPDKARITPSDHGHPETVLLKDLKPWTKGIAEQEAVREIHKKKDPLAVMVAKAERELELCVLFDPRVGRFMGGIAMEEKDGRPIPKAAVAKKAGPIYPLDKASRLPRSQMASLHAFARKSQMLDSSSRYMTIPEAEKLWAMIQAEEAAQRKAKADAIEAERLARVAAEKAEAEKAIAAVPSLPEPKPTPAPVQAPETAPARREPASPALEKALAERTGALRALAYAENLVLEAKGKLVMANAEVEIARGG